jgi:UPF0716 protein FxsA
MRRTRFLKWFFLIWLCLEIAGFVWVAELIGLGWMLLLIIASMVLGFVLLRQEGLRTANIMMQKMRNKERLQPSDIADAPFVMIGAMLLIIPGFFSDILGVLCFIPVIRRGFVALLSRSGTRRKQTTQQQVDQGKTYEGDYQRED